MTHLTSKVAFIVFYWMSMISMLSAHYCEWGLCDPSQYCCKENTCCSTEEYSIFFIVALTLGISAIIMISCACLYCNIRKIQSILPERYFGITYVIMRSSSNVRTQPGMNEASLREKNNDSCVI